MIDENSIQSHHSKNMGNWWSSAKQVNELQERVKALEDMLNSGHIFGSYEDFHSAMDDLNHQVMGLEEQLEDLKEFIYLMEKRFTQYNKLENTLRLEPLFKQYMYLYEWLFPLARVKNEERVKEWQEENRRKNNLK